MKYAVDAGAFSKNCPEFAKKRADQLKKAGIDGVSIHSGEKYDHVIVGPYDTEMQASSVRAILTEKGYSGGILRVEDKKPQNEAQTKPQDKKKPTKQPAD